MLVSGETEYVNCRAVNQRRVDVRGAFALSIEAVAEAQGEVITALAGGGIQQRTTSLTGSKAVGSQEKLITAEESIAFDAPPEMVLSTQCTGAVNEVKLVSGKAVLKGEIRAEVVYRTAPGHTLVHTTRQIPFNEILDVEGLGGVQLGPSDLALGLGIKETYNFDNPQVKSRFERLFKKAKEKGIPLMGPIAPPNLERAIEMAENGVRVMTLRNDVTNFKCS